MHIGEVADAAGVPTPTIRVYERRGMHPQPPWAPTDVGGRLAFIRSGQRRATLVELASIPDLLRDGAVPCARVY